LGWCGLGKPQQLSGIMQWQQPSAKQQQLLQLRLALVQLQRQVLAMAAAAVRASLMPALVWCCR
jgi:hypothetical protein